MLTALILGNAALFVLGALQHAGVAIGPLREPVIIPASIVELLCALVLIWGAAVVLIRSHKAWRANRPRRGLVLFRKPIWRIRIARYFGRVIFLPAALCSHYAFGSHACRLNLVGYVERPVGQSSGDGDGGLCIEANGKRREQYRTERLPDDLIDHNISFRALRGNRACLNAAFRHGDHLV